MHRLQDFKGFKALEILQSVHNWTALFILVFWINRTISDLKGQNETQDERLRQMGKKIEQLFVLWNKHIDRLLDEARRNKEK